MNTPLFVQAAHYDVLPARENKLQPRQRFVEYQADLHRIAGLELDPATLTRGDQYTFVELADTLLEKAGKELVEELDVFVTSYWTPEFDPDISAFGPYLHHRYALDCKSFDLVDQGSISPVLALLVLGDYLRAGENSGDGVLLAVEQSTVPAAVGAHFPGPARSSAGVIRLSRRAQETGAQILAVTSLNETEAMDRDFGVSDLAGRWCGQFGIDPDELTVVLRRNTFLYRKWAYQLGEGAWAYKVNFLPPQNTCTGVFQWLSAVLRGERDDGGYVLFAEEDVESLAAAAVLVKLGGGA